MKVDQQLAASAAVHVQAERRCSTNQFFTVLDGNHERMESVKRQRGLTVSCDQLLLLPINEKIQIFSRGHQAVRYQQLPTDCNHIASHFGAAALDEQHQDEF